MILSQRRSISISGALAVAMLIMSSDLARSAPLVAPPVILSPPVLTPSPNSWAPLGGTIQLTTDVPTRVDLLITDSTHTWRVTAEQNLRTSHRFKVLGVRPNETNTIRLSVRDAAGAQTTWPGTLTLVTPPLPVEFPLLHVTTDTPTRMEPGVTFFTTRFSSPTLPGSGSFMVVLDSAGQVIWYYKTAEGIQDGNRLRNGNLIYMSGTRLAVEVDMLGNLVHQWWAAGMGTAGAPPGAVMVNLNNFHHELHEMPLGEAADFIALSTELRVYPNYPADEVNQSMTVPTANVVGDTLVEFKRDGTIVRETKLLDILDPYRICYGSLTSFYNPVYGVTTNDLMHGNALYLDQNDDTYVVSLRHQDAVVKIQRTTGQLVWICGPHDEWNAPWNASLLTPIGSPFEWNYHEHAPHLSADGHLMMFDNGNFRVSPPNPPPPISQWYSRAVEFKIDPAAMTVEQTWLYDGNGTPFFSAFIGNAEPQLHGNALVTDGAKQVPGQNKTYSRIVEVTRSINPPQPVFEVILNDPALPSDPYNWNVYRAYHYKSVYPGF